MHTMIIPTETVLQTAARSTNEISEAGKIAWNSLQCDAGKPFEDYEETQSSSSSSLSDIDESTNDFSLEEMNGPLVASSKRSILKSRTKYEPRYIQDKKWKCLPPPSKVPNHGLPAEVPTESKSIESKRVSFDSVRIRSYQQTMGDNPSVSYGAPIQLDWDYEEHEDLCIDLYESERGLSRRTLRQLAMNYYRRKSVLTREYGFSEEELTKAKKDVKKEQFRRYVTNYFLPMMKVEDAIESAGRKAKRMIRKGKE